MSSPQQHSTLGASGAFRWLACAGSVRMSAGVGDSGAQSPYAAEGTQAHDYAEKMLKNTPVSDDVVGLASGVPAEMADHLKIYTQLVREFQVMCDWHEIEHMFSLESLNPPVDAFGTADFVGYVARDYSLIVADLKYGSGVLVEVEGNSQLMYYALGALLTFQQMQIDKGDTPVRVDKVRMVIVQPRAYHPDGAVREATIDVMDLMDWSIDLIDAMHATQQPDAPLVPGKHCRFCRAAAICPALLEQNQEIAKGEFGTLQAGEDVVDTLADPRTLSPEHVGEMLARLDGIEHWINSVRMYAQNELERGSPIPGWKLVAKQARRKWKSDGATLTWAQEKGLVVTETKFKSPAQVEKLLTTGNKIPDDLIVKQSSGNKIAHADSSLPEVVTGSEFFK